jgi:poly(glycerol-phosphate) alpha-glucosyltransferase
MTAQQVGRKHSVLFSTGSLREKSSGPFQSLYATVTTLVNRGHSLRIIGTHHRHEIPTSTEWRGPSVSTFLKLGPDSWHIAPDLQRWLTQQDAPFDAISIQNVWLKSNLDVANWAYSRKIPYLLAVHGNFNSVALSFSKFKKLIARKLFFDKMFQRAACLQALNEAEYKAIRAYGIDRPVCIIPNGVSIPEPIDPSSILPQEFDGKNVLLYLGRLHPIKNLEALLTSWSRTRNECATWRLVIAGDGPEPYKRKLRELVEMLGVADSVQFVGYVEGASKSAWLAGATAFVLPSKSEGLPMAALEAMAAGTPVLLTRQCNLPEVETEEVGLLTDTTPDALAHDMRRLMNQSDDQLKKMGERARRFVAKSYSWDKVCDQMEEVFAWMIEGGEAPACVRTH